MYPQSDDYVRLLSIRPSKGIIYKAIAQWEHFFVLKKGIHRNGYRMKVHFLGFD